ncbi:MAG TPA: hypothetical protein VMV44_08950 [Rectinemataceae bacterium]|nr:hypothetical protein [Rectinemataceae bacterium]
MKKPRHPGFRHILALTASLALSSCYLPTFDSSISAGLLFEKELGSPDVTVGPVAASWWSDEETVFLPERVQGARTGVVAWQGSGSSNLAYLTSDANALPSMVSMSYTATLPSGSLRPFIAMASYAAGTSTPLLALQSYGLTEWTSSSATTSVLDFGTSWTATGAGSTQVAAAGDIEVDIIFTNGSQWGALVDTLANVASLGSITAPPISLASPGLPLGGSFFALSASGPFVYGEPNGGRVAVWDGPASSPRILDLGQPLVGMLSDGHLVTQGSLELSVWDIQAKRVLSVPAGNIRFIQELSTASGEFVVLTRCLQTATKSAPNIWAQSWEIPLADFLKL